MDKFVKLDAIKRIAKPMAEFHKGEESEMESEEEYVCPKCGHSCVESDEMEESEDEEY